jgi:hypothetical protein
VAKFLGLLQHLPQIAAVPSPEVLMFVERRALMGKGLEWIDVHLLASTVASGHALWTRDKRLTPLSGLVSSLKRAAAIAKKSICQNRQIPTGDVTDVHHHTV